MHKIYCISLSNINQDLIGFNSVKIETKFIDTLASDSFVLKKHFTSSITPWDSFFSLITGASMPTEDDSCIVNLLGTDVTGMSICQRRDVKQLIKKYHNSIDVYQHPNDLATTAIKYIKSDCNFFYAHYVMQDSNENSIIKIDSAFGKLMAAIEEFGDYNESYVLFTAFHGLPGKATPCLLKIPESKSLRFYASSRKVEFVTRDVDIIPTILDFQEEYYKLPPSIDGTTIINNLLGKDQKLYAINRPVLIDYTGEIFLK